VANPSFNRRNFLIGALTTLTLLARSRPLFALDRKVGPRPHPTPRPGIDASHMLSSDELADFPRARVSFDEVRQIPEIVDGICCRCGCDQSVASYSLLSCYEGKNAMAKWCPTCQGQGRLAFRLHNDGKSLDEIRAAIDKEFGS
jgi:hypothetical protein